MGVTEEYDTRAVAETGFERNTGQPLGGARARITNLKALWQYRMMKTYAFRTVRRTTSSGVIPADLWGHPHIWTHTVLERDGGDGFTVLSQQDDPRPPFRPCASLATPAQSTPTRSRQPLIYLPSPAPVSLLLDASGSGSLHATAHVLARPSALTWQ